MHSQDAMKIWFQGLTYLHKLQKTPLKLTVHCSKPRHNFVLV